MTHSSICLMEALESRLLLAGNVNCELVNGVLTLVGDAEANRIQFRNYDPGVLTVEAIDGTTLNGDVGAASYFYEDITGIRAILKAGNNLFDFNIDLAPLTVASIKIKSGAWDPMVGNTNIIVAGLSATGNVKILAVGKGTSIIATDSLNGADIVIRAKGADSVNFSDTVANTLTVKVGKGIDSISLDNVDAVCYLFGGAEDTVSIGGTPPANLNLGNMVIDNALPVIENGPALLTLTVPLGSPIGTYIGTILASDDDSNPLTYIDDSPAFAVDSDGVITLELAVANTVGTIFPFTVQVLDWEGGPSASIWVTVIAP